MDLTSNDRLIWILNRLMFHTTEASNVQYARYMVKSVISCLPDEAAGWTYQQLLKFLLVKMNDYTDTDCMSLRAIFLPYGDFSETETVHLVSIPGPNEDVRIPLFTCAVAGPDVLHVSGIWQWLTTEYKDKDIVVEVLDGRDPEKFTSLAPNHYQVMYHDDMTTLAVVYARSSDMQKKHQFEDATREFEHSFGREIADPTMCNIGRTLWRIAKLKGIPTEYPEQVRLALTTDEESSKESKSGLLADVLPDLSEDKVLILDNICAAMATIFPDEKLFTAVMETAKIRYKSRGSNELEGLKTYWEELIKEPLMPYDAVTSLNVAAVVKFQILGAMAMKCNMSLCAILYGLGLIHALNSFSNPVIVDVKLPKKGAFTPDTLVVVNKIVDSLKNPSEDEKSCILYGKFSWPSLNVFLQLMQNGDSNVATALFAYLNMYEDDEYKELTYQLPEEYVFTMPIVVESSTK